MLIDKILRLPNFEQAGAGGGDPVGGKPAGGDPAGGDPAGGKPAGGDPAGGKPNALLALAQQIIAEQGGKPTGGDPAAGGEQLPPELEAMLPKDFPKHLAGKDARETLDKLFTAYSGARSDIAKRGEVPKAASEYKLELTDTQKKIFGNDLVKDPAYKLWTEVAHEHGLTNKEFGVFAKFFEKMQGAGLLEPSIEPEAEIGKLGDDLKEERDPGKKRAEGAKRMVQASTWIDGLQSRKVLEQGEAEILRGLTVSANGVRILEKLSKLGDGTGVQAGGASPTGVRGKAEIERDMMDPRYATTSRTYDPVFRSRVDEEFKRAVAAGFKA